MSTVSFNKHREKKKTVIIIFSKSINMNVHSRPQQQTPVLLMVLHIAGSAELVAERLAQKPLCCATTWP